MKKLLFISLVLILSLSSCGSGQSTKKRSLDDTLYKYAATIRWANFDAAVRFLDPTNKDILPTPFELEKLKQFKVSRYAESPIAPGASEDIILQDVEIQFYNIHNNRTKTVYDHQAWQYNDDLKRWLLISGLPKL